MCEFLTLHKLQHTQGFKYTSLRAWHCLWPWGSWSMPGYGTSPECPTKEHIIFHHTPPQKSRGPEVHVRDTRGFQGMLSMDQALCWEGRQYRIVTKQRHSHKANRLPLGTIKCCCLYTETHVRAPVMAHPSWGCALPSGTAFGWSSML